MGNNRPKSKRVSPTLYGLEFIAFYTFLSKGVKMLHKIPQQNLLFSLFYLYEKMRGELELVKFNRFKTFKSLSHESLDGDLIW